MAIHDKTTKSNYERSLTQLSHNLQKYISLTLIWTLAKLCKKRDHGMVYLQHVLTETFKQDSSRHQVWNIDKLYTRRNMCIKIEKKQHIWDKGEEKHTSSHIYIYQRIQCVWSQDYGTCNEKGIHKNLTTSLKNTLPLSRISYASSPPNT